MKSSFSLLIVLLNCFSLVCGMDNNDLKQRQEDSYKLARISTYLELSGDYLPAHHAVLQLSGGYLPAYHDAFERKTSLKENTWNRTMSLKLQIHKLPPNLQNSIATYYMQDQYGYSNEDRSLNLDQAQLYALLRVWPLVQKPDKYRCSMELFFESIAKQIRVDAKKMISVWKTFPETVQYFIWDKISTIWLLF